MSQEKEAMLLHPNEKRLIQKIRELGHGIITDLQVRNSLPEEAKIVYEKVRFNIPEGKEGR